MIVAVGAALLTLLVSCECRAELYWLTNILAKEACQGTEYVDFEYLCENRGTVQVKVLATQSTCSCVKPLFTELTVKPGGVGSVKFRFNLLGEMGRLEKAATVQTDDSPRALSELRMIVQIDTPLSVEPRLLMWKLNEARTEKTAEIFLGKRIVVNRMVAECLDAAFGANVQCSERGKWILCLTPKSDAPPRQAVVRITATTVEGRVLSATLFAKTH